MVCPFGGPTLGHMAGHDPWTDSAFSIELFHARKIQTRVQQAAETTHDLQGIPSAPLPSKPVTQTATQLPPVAAQQH